MREVTLDEGANYVTSARVSDNGVVLTFRSKLTGKQDQILLAADEMEMLIGIWREEREAMRKTIEAAAKRGD